MQNPTRVPLRLQLCLCLAATLPSRAADKTTYEDQILPVFQQSCLNCHNPDKAKGGLDLSSYAGALKGGSGGKIVEPGDAGSKLLTSVMRTADPKMPPEGDALDPAKIALIKAWIDGGLPENKNSSARPASKPAFNLAVRTNAAAKPDGPPPMPEDLLLDPPVVTSRAGAVRALAASPWAPLLAVSGQKQILLYHTETLELAGILPFPEGEPVSLAFTPDARFLIVGGGVSAKSGLTVTFEIKTGARILTVAKEFDTILAADIRPGFDLVATGGPSRLLKLWNTRTGELMKSIKKHTDWITALDLSPDGVLLASGDRNGGVWVWEADTGSEFLTLRAHQAAITATSFRADSNILATASADGTVRFWEMNNGTEVRKIDAHPGGVTAFAFARDGSSLTTGRDRKVKLWKPDFTPARELAANLPALPTSAAISQDGKRAFIGDYQGAVRVIDTTTAKTLGEITSNPPSIESRLRTLSEQIRTQPQAIAGCEAKRADAERAAATAKQALAAAEQAKPADPKAKLDLQAKLASATEIAARAKADLTSSTQKLAELKACEKFWQAAAINTKALAARAEAGRLASHAHELYDSYPSAAKALDQQADALNRKRSERTSFANRYAQAPPPLATEVAATLEALDAIITRAETSLHHAEQEFLALRDTIQQAAPAAQNAATQAAQLQSAYQSASKR